MARRAWSAVTLLKYLTQFTDEEGIAEGGSVESVIVALKERIVNEQIDASNRASNRAAKSRASDE